ncbi:unnamed protein product [Owenia fusiformis]|uniref:Uncharacterized protein n=1 Tax=Owenia fusiformis TaxID=6347 RepID=A0A8J1Y0W3_OWEFU|nr:unnamed protein product [Owenia fusiformis]
MATLMYKVTKNKVPRYVHDIYRNLQNPGVERALRARHEYNIPARSSTKFTNSPAIAPIRIWKTISLEVKNSPSISAFKSRYNKWKYNPNPRSVLTTKLNLKRSIEIKLNRIRVDLASRADFYRHNFKEFTDPSCPCGYQQQTKSHLLLDCPLSNGAREVFTQNLKELPSFNYNNFATLTKSSKIKIMLFGDCKLSDECNKEITNLSANLIDKII